MLSFQDFPAHVRLMFLTMRRPLSKPERSQCLELMAAAVDWSAFRELIVHHRVGSLVYITLTELKPDCSQIPEDLLSELRNAARSNAGRSILAAAEYQRIAQHFAAEGFELSLLKGIALSQQVYGSPCVRSLGDIDLLSTRERLSRQVDLMGELGYQLTVPEAHMTPRRIASYSRYWKDFTFSSADREFIIELHWRLFNNNVHPGNKILTDAVYETAFLFGLPVRTLAPADHFLYQAVHGISDAWIYLKTLADIGGYLRVLSASELGAALARSERLGLLPQLSAAIHLANDWLGANCNHARLLPPDDRLALAVRRRTEARLLERDFRPGRDDPSPADWLRLELALVPGLRSRMEVARRILNRPRLWSRWDLPDSLFWLYPVLGALLPPRSHTPISDRGADQADG